MCNVPCPVVCHCVNPTHSCRDALPSAHQNAPSVPLPFLYRWSSVVFCPCCYRLTSRLRLGCHRRCYYHCHYWCRNWATIICDHCRHFHLPFRRLRHQSRINHRLNHSTLVYLGTSLVLSSSLCQPVNPCCHNAHVLSCLLWICLHDSLSSFSTCQKFVLASFTFVLTHLFTHW